MRAYQLRGKEWCILHYAEIRDFLYGLYLKAGISSSFVSMAHVALQAPVDRHICDQKLVNVDRLHDLDIQHLGAQVASCLQDRAQSFYEGIENSESSKDIGQSIVDLLQAVQFQFSYESGMLIDVA